MITLILRGSLALSAAMGLLAVLMNPFVTPSVNGAPFSAILQELRGASTLQFQLKKTGDSQASEILVRAPGLVRKQDSPQRYQIAVGSRWWKVDESENTVTTGDSPWFRNPVKQVDLLGLLDVGVKEASALLTARPTQRKMYQGHDCLVYRVNLPGDDQELRIEAFADAANNQLVGIIAFNAADGEGAVPLAELQLIALNPAVGDEQFVVAKSLTEDGRIGKITSSQGIVVLRPALARRWTPICRDTLLRPGDWVRTELRGPNAVKLQLSSDVELTLGPGTLMECISPTQARLHNGQVQVNSKGAEKTEFTLLAPLQRNRLFKPGMRQLVRIDATEKIVDVPQIPIWLAGFEGTSTNESLGSLIVNLPDGRNEPLSVGYHKVSVEIRDQIARTTIEESFVNHTKSQLEGVFHFPLPQDASISGFGMWIGDELVEADVVEKQRAREIFETILREKRDPGLLEWMGGNIFKARVFPIEAHSEKRIKIVYTQVLPLRANRYRYAYGLRSELLRTKPLRELSLSVTVNSALPLKSISCPTHAVRTQQAAHSGQVEFAAQDYTPTRDFEVVCEVDGKQSDAVVVPHRRGADGYFLVQLNPPGPEGNWQRELLPDGKPLQILLVCDTSSSMDAEKRRQQAEFVGTVLASLGTEDQFQLACADVNAVWASPEPMKPTHENIAATRKFLEERISLGWTNLDRAFAEIVQKSHPDAHVIYIGDGIVSAGTTDPSAFVQKIKQLTGSVNGKPSNRTFHSVIVGNSHDTVVMKGIAAVGHGSTRSITGEQTPNMIALELLNEIAQPGLRDLNVEFRGLRVAAVYPGELPNVAAGTQQILVGRYLPEGKDQSGEIVVTGMRGNEKVKYAAKVSLKDAEKGNSFIPRLWARAHLDHLLAQGTSSQVREDIIRLSEEFHIITPYTSLLVLESDADRERFGVKRRYEMRDGERFFAEGKANANFELVQAQMKKAGSWRFGLRNQVVRGFKNYGRNVDELEQTLWQFSMNRSDGFFGGGGMGGMGGGMGFGGWGGVGSGVGLTGLGLGGMGGGVDTGMDGGEMAFETTLSLAIEQTQSVMENEMALDGAMAELNLGVTEETDADGTQMENDGLFDGFAARDMIVNGRMPYLDLVGRIPSYAEVDQATGSYTDWVNLLFPHLERQPAVRLPLVKTKNTWSPEAIALSNSLLRTDSLKKLAVGFVLSRTSESFDPAWNRRSARNTDLVLYSPTQWMSKSGDAGAETVVNFCGGKERGVYSLAFLLGRKRPQVDADLDPAILNLTDYSLHSLQEFHSDATPVIEAAGENRANLILTDAISGRSNRVLIDTKRHVVLKTEIVVDGRSTGSTTYDDFVEIGGTWWARRITHVDANGAKTSETILELQVLDKPQFDQRFQQELAAREATQFIQLPFVTLKESRQKTIDGSASFDHRLAMILHLALRQQWDEMWKHVDTMEQQGKDKPGLRWIRTFLLIASRRNEEASKRFADELRKLVAAPQLSDLYLANMALDQISEIVAKPELLPLVLLVKPIYDRQPAETDAVGNWTERRIQCHLGMDEWEQALALKRSLAESAPWNLHRQLDYARQLTEGGQPAAAIAWLRREMDRPVTRSPHEDDSLRSAVVEHYRTRGEWGEMLKFTTEWVGRNPISSGHHSAYPQHLMSLVCNDEREKADTLAQLWLDDAHVEGRLTPLLFARCDAALVYALGHNRYFSSQQVDERWLEPLAKFARDFVRNPHHSDFAWRVMNRLRDQDVIDRLRGEFLNLLRNDLPKLSPAQIQNLISWTLSGRMELPEPLKGRRQLDASEVSDEVWESIATSLKGRWAKAENHADQRQLGEALRSIYSARFHDSRYIPFLREQLAKSHVDDVVEYRTKLFSALQEIEWNAEVEQEAFKLLGDLSLEKDPVDRLPVQLPALYRLVDAMLANRIAVAEEKISDKGGRDKLTRNEIAAQNKQIRQTALTELSDRLGAEAGRVDGPLSDWLSIEQTWLDLQAGRRQPQALQLCWKLLGDVPPKSKHEVDPEDDVRALIEPAFPNGIRIDEKDHKDAISAILHQRALITVFKLATGRKGSPETIAQVIKYLDAGIAQETSPVPADVSKQTATPGSRWRNSMFDFLVALDRPEELERRLRQWIKDDVSTAPWRRYLARLQAERGLIAEAVQLFEACQKDQLLSASDYKLLADWYQVLDRRQEHERAQMESFKQMREDQLLNLLDRLCNRWDQPDSPTPELDDQTLLALKTLFEKARVPETGLEYFFRAYDDTHDFRLLQMLPDAVLGRSPLMVYSYLKHLNDSVLGQLHNEATADEILARVKVLREGQRTPTDLRALDLMEALIERKSSEVLDQADVHIDASFAALQRAFLRKIEPDEASLMANFLTQLGGLPSRLADEQLRQLKDLQKLAPANSRNRLQITTEMCNLLCAYDRHDEAIRMMEVEVNAYSQANQGGWPNFDNPIIGRFVEMYEHTGEFAAGEAILRRFHDKSKSPEQKQWFDDRMLTLHVNAYEADGATTLGNGCAELFESLHKLILSKIAAVDDEQLRHRLVIRLFDLFRSAHQNSLARTTEYVERFVFDVLPGLLRKQTTTYLNTVTYPMAIIADIAGPKAALRYMIERIEQFPQRLEMDGDSAGKTFGNELARRRAEVGPSEFDARILKFVLAELRTRLRTGQDNCSSTFTRKGNQTFWAEKLPAFVQLADEVLADNRTSGRRIMTVASFFRDDLGMTPRSIEILLVANKQGLLDHQAQSRLVSWLQSDNRFAESITLLESLMAAHPDAIQYRTQLMTAYFQSKRPQQLAELLKQTDEHFHQGGRWDEGNAHQLAMACLQCQLTERAVPYVIEAISLHQRANPGSGLDNEMLVIFNKDLARAYSRLKKTREAVDAISAAIVCQGPDRSERESLLEQLKEILSSAEDLDDYVTSLDAKVAETLQDSPILRRIVGTVYMEQSLHAKAIPQLRLALELQPNDAQIHTSLIDCYDAIDDAQAATRQLLKLIELKPHDLDLYLQLADRLIQNEEESERAETSIVEASPTEAENHAALAERRQSQDRWTEAIALWERVAELRKLEPNGLLKLAAAQIHQEQWDNARSTINKLRKTEWPTRFTNVEAEASALEMQIPAK
ncbi:MAG: VIT domain-containing protein [Planctomycetota bacterium]